MTSICHRSRLWAGSILLLAGGLAGCTGGSDDKWSEQRPATYPVQGTVLYNGEPVADASVSFSSTGGDKSVGAAGKTDDQGTFTLTTYEPGDGAVAGEHRVTVIKAVVEGEDPSYFDENSPNYGKEPPPTTTKYLVPKKYASFETSGLTATVSESSDNEITIELND
ncbi:Nickel uptake substrate-specific transmembrane region [Maioricimonas rarisocia]|uniref:Nickel uptake substrate-specific transmembrane region n=1 Tax=Maioricimonas rarisocia TaxID=2528026 RepID=A0A517Z5S6_9PLAN|nr:DUF4198 domain-containing protein [Maioricimonas rarisocia]QDU37814.1 Nickel uptake substrate-specific transmembrane region [Maioricimonas rarisocia]